MFSHKKILVIKKIQSKFFLQSQTFFAKKKFRHKKNLVKKKFSYTKMLVTKKFKSQKNFSH